MAHAGAARACLLLLLSSFLVGTPCHRPRQHMEILIVLSNETRGTQETAIISSRDAPCSEKTFYHRQLNVRQGGNISKREQIFRLWKMLRIGVASTMEYAVVSTQTPRSSTAIHDLGIFGAN